MTDQELITEIHAITKQLNALLLQACDMGIEFNVNVYDATVAGDRAARKILSIEHFRRIISIKG